MDAIQKPDFPLRSKAIDSSPKDTKVSLLNPQHPTCPACTEQKKSRAGPLRGFLQDKALTGFDQLRV
ncbi:MAG: hypothetical protein ABI893_16220 [Polaromonas sp.]|uniref:hypothetical protein n=1 Tax=Polaromonas sp. TaxID=1869339 RepID=UPI003264C0FF